VKGPATGTLAEGPRRAESARAEATARGSGLVHSTPFTYHDRQSKALYIADKYRSILGGSVLDVGCDVARLRNLVAHPSRYVGVDLGPAADLQLNLDRDDLPCGDRSFDTVLATDVLEHLERCHAIFDELCRVAARHVVVSLPNPLHNLIHELTTGATGEDGRGGGGGANLKYYGLPTDAPGDRHRWFFGAEEAARFLRERGERLGYAVEQLDFEEPGLPSLRTRDGVNICTHPNLRLGTLWCVLARREGA